MAKASVISRIPFALWLLIPSLILNIFLLLRPHPSSTPLTVLGVIDGDTLVVDEKTRIRLRQVDAPELSFCGGKQAKQQLEALVRGKQIHIEELIPDQYGRGMALVFVGNTNVNEAMLTGGWVRYHSDHTSQTDILKAAAQQAKDQHLGIYGHCQSTQNTKHPDCPIKGNIDPQGGAKRYYLPGCAQYPFTIVEEDLGEQWFCTEAEAKQAGYARAATCTKS